MLDSLWAETSHQDRTSSFTAQQRDSSTENRLVLQHWKKTLYVKCILLNATRQRKRHSENPFPHRSIFNYRIQYYYFITDDYMAIYKLLLNLNVIERQHANETAKSLSGGLTAPSIYLPS